MSLLSPIINAYGNYIVKRRRVLTAATALALVAAAPVGPAFAPGFAVTAHRALPGAKAARMQIWTLRRTDSAGGPVTLALALAPGAAARVRIAVVGRRAAARPLYASADCPGASAMVNGSFFEGADEDERIQGLVRIDGRTAQGPSGRRSGGFLATDGRGLTVFDRAQAAEALAAPNAIESTPILVRNGASGMRSDDHVHADRVAAGVTTDGDIVLVGAFGEANDGVSLYEFEQLARAAVGSRGRALRDLIAGDGGPSAHMWLPRAGVFLGQTGSIFLTDVVCVGARSGG